MKPQFIIICIVLFIFSCEKGENNPTGTYAFDVSIFGTYSMHFLDAPNTLSYACEEAELRTITAKSASAISFNNLDLSLDSAEDDIYVFKQSTGSIGYQVNYTISHYPCADSIVYQRTSNYDYRVGYGKKVDGQDCPDSTPSDFEMMYCHEGPDNAYCYSSYNTKYKLKLGTISQLNYLFTDTVNQTVQIGIPESLAITLPTDSSLKLLTGEYRLTETPAEGEQPILKVSMEEYYEWSVNTQDFEDGYLSVDQSGDTYTISFQFTCSENTVWTGYYEGSIE